MTWVGLKNYRTVLEVPDLLGTIFNAFRLVVFFSFIPVSAWAGRCQRHPPRGNRAAWSIRPDRSVPATGHPACCCGDYLGLAVWLFRA